MTEKPATPDSVHVTDGAPPRYATDLTLADAEAVQAFLNDRTGDVWREGKKGTTPLLMARALNTLGTTAWAVMKVELDSLNRPKHPLNNTECRQALRRLSNAWRDLLVAAAPWRGHPDYDTARWSSVHFLDAQDEQLLEAYRAKDPAAAGS